MSGRIFAMSTIIFKEHFVKALKWTSLIETDFMRKMFYFNKQSN